MPTQVKLPRIHVGVGTSVGGLTVFPVWVDAPALEDLATGTQARIEVKEREAGPSVAQLELMNVGQEWALLIESELLEGGWQHRALNEDVILGPGELVTVAVSCVEAGRWHGGQSHSRRARRSPVNIAAGLREEEGQRQSEVWSRVADFEGVRTYSATSSLVDHLDAAGTAGPHPRPRPLDGQRGVVIGIGGVPASLELFPSPAALAEHWEGLIDAAELAAELGPQRHTPGQAARDFVVAVASTPIVADVGAGTGHRLSARRRGISVRGTTHRDQLAHMTALNERHQLLAG